MPCQDQELWSQIIVPISMQMTDQEIINTVNWWADHKEERLLRVEKAQRLVAKYTHHAMIDLLLEEYYLFKGGARGIYCPVSFVNPNYNVTL